MSVRLITNTSCDRCDRRHLCKELNTLKNDIENLTKEFDSVLNGCSISIHEHKLKLYNCKNFKNSDCTNIVTGTVSPLAHVSLDKDAYREEIITNRKRCMHCDFKEQCLNYDDRNECADFLMKLTKIPSSSHLSFCRGTDDDKYSFSLTWICDGYREVENNGNGK